MEILGIGVPEILFILIIALIVLGPRDMQKAGKTIGVWLNTLVRSEWWRAFRRTSDELRRLPTNLMREANREMMDVERDLREKMEPPSIAGPRAPLPTSPAVPAPPPKADVQPEPKVSNPPDAEIHPEKKTVKPLDQQEG